MTPDITAKARAIRLLALDCDGVLTDGSLLYGNNGEDLKAFSILDGLGIKLLRTGGVEVAIITGRRSALLERRARELGIELLLQGREDKLVALRELIAGRGIALDAVAYCGDDLPDLPAIRAAGLGIAPANAWPLVREHADWVTTRTGGSGAVREICEGILHAQGKLQATLAPYLGDGKPA